MKIHHLEHLLSEIVFLGALIFPVAVVLAALVGLITWIVAGPDMGVQASWITLCATIVLVPIYIRVSCGPDTRVDCDHCTMMASRRNHRNGQPIRKEQRRHPRYRIELTATFVNDRTSGFVRIGNISARGCRVESRITVTRGDFGQLLIELPGCSAPLKVSYALVRWATGNECGMEFIRLDQEEQGLLSRFIGQLDVGAVIPAQC